jgi:hypothetical protein
MNLLVLINGYKTKLKSVFLVSFLVVLSGCSLSGKKIYQTEQGAIRGYDPVAYFIDNKAVAGDRHFTSTSLINKQLVTWHFSSLQNKQLFERDPEKYTPQYGGYCAYAMSYGLVVSSDPHAFSIIDDKLYLNYSLSVRDKWLKSPQQFIKEADVKWQEKGNEPNSKPA